VKALVGFILIGAACVGPVLGADRQEVTITSTPEGAMVFINNEYAGMAPVSKTLAPGSYHVRLRRTGYRDWTGNITVPMEDSRIEAVLQAHKRGSITITSDPPECTVYVNGQEEGITPLLLQDLADDLYEIRVQTPNFSPQTQTVEIADGEDVSLAVKLQSRIEEYLRAQIENNPDDLPKYAELGHHYLLEGEWDKAIEVLKQGSVVAGRRTGRSAEVMRFYQELCKAYTGQFRFGGPQNMPQFRERFGEVMEFAIETGAQKHPYYQRLVSLYAAMGQGERVRALVERMHAANPKRGVHAAFGGIYLERGMSAEAIEMFKRAIEIEDTFETRFALARAYHRRGQFEKALEEYTRCEAMDAPASVQAKLKFEMSRLYAQTGENDKALQYIDEALKRHKQDAWVMLKIRVLLNDGNCEEARLLVKELSATSSPHTRKGARAMLELINERCGQNENGRK
jgi:tetratricopeptide (TPR) repeat protein